MCVCVCLVVCSVVCACVCARTRVCVVYLEVHVTSVWSYSVSQRLQMTNLLDSSRGVVLIYDYYMARSNRLLVHMLVFLYH